MKLPPILCLLLIGILLSALKTEADDQLAVPIIARPGCKDSCGNVSIPFPWGIGANCFLDSWFEINCKPSPHSKPFLSKFNIEVVEIQLSPYRIITVHIPPLNVCTADTQRHQLSSVDLRGSPYNFSTDFNVFAMGGCAGSAVLSNQSEGFMAGCATVCSSNDSVIPSNECYGVECCQMELPAEGPSSEYSPLQFYQIDAHRKPSGRLQNCLAATIISSDSVNRYMGKLSTSNPPTVPVVLLWSWISSLRPDHNNSHSKCSYSFSLSNSLYCSCDDLSYGINPYVTNGCQVVKVCEGCKGFCVYGNKKYYCHPPDRLSFDSYLASTTAIIVYLALSIAIVPLLMVFGCRCLYYFTKRRRKVEKRVTFFKLMLQRHQSSNGVIENTKVFTHKELDKATDHFNDNRVLGKGGQGTVYKGMLVDGRIVAVKKSKRMDETQMEQFINEMVILSQINHRNVVKVLGCCLETEVPLLVYEFISNKTLYQHIHEHPDADFRLSWAMRLKIASDSAGAIAYLHSSSSTPVYHRDIKTSNILLDDKYRAKVSDFGSSKTIAIDQTHLTTLVQGTIGYLDPEYFESYIFTEKSDVYSFGVVLLELLTSKKPIYRDETMEQKSLVTQFFFHLHNFCLSNILDPEVVKEAREEQLMAMVDLAKCCLNESGRLRPTMKEVAMTLEMIIKSQAETSSRDQQAFPDKGFTEFIMSEISDAEFMSSTIASDSASPLYIDVEPLLRDTI